MAMPKLPQTLTNNHGRYCVYADTIFVKYQV